MGPDQEPEGEALPVHREAAGRLERKIVADVARLDPLDRGREVIAQVVAEHWRPEEHGREERRIRDQERDDERPGLRLEE